MLYTATHSETLEPYVVYQALYGEGGIWVRPASMWNELVGAGRQSHPAVYLYRRITPFMAKTGLGFHPQPGFFMDRSCPFSDQIPCPKEQPLRQRFQLPFGQSPLFEGEGDFQDAPVLRRKEGEKVPLPAQVLAGHPKVLGLEDKGR